MLTHSTEITNRDDIIDSRDIEARIEQLTALEQPGPVDLGNDADNEQDQDILFAELKALRKLAEEAESYAPDWTYRATLVRDSYFKEYAEQLAEDCDLIQAGATWPNNCIDWDEAARQLKMNYTEVDFDGIAYWIR